MISSIRMDGLTACMTIEGATDTEVIRAYVSDLLCPTLRPGNIVIMDSLAPHKSDSAIGVEVLFLPANSPDLNPIEKTGSKVKSILRSAEA
ncbi:MAG: transposase [Terrimicrobiaceae bacterium]